MHPSPVKEDAASLISAFVPVEKMRILRSSRQEDRRRKATAHLLSSVLLGEKLDIGYEQLSFRRGQYGKPFLDGESAPAFNVSYSERLVVCGIAEQPLGIDVEHIKPIETLMMRMLLGQTGVGLTEYASEAEQQDFYARWTRLESWLKAEGTGLHDQYPLSSFDPTPMEAGYFVADAQQANIAPWIIEPLSVVVPAPERYLLTVCRRPEEQSAENVVWMDEDELIRRFRKLVNGSTARWT